MSKEIKFRFRSPDSVGSNAAEHDARMLEECFVETGDLQELRDCTSPRRIVVGRTGAGKTALLLKLARTEERCIDIQPETLALAYISNSTILKCVAKLGVKLDIFFRLLWRHVFTVEVLRTHFGIVDEEAQQTVLQRLFAHFKGDKHAKALEYLKKWGRKFWEDPEYRIKEITSSIETNLSDSIKLKLSGFGVSVEDVEKLSHHQKAELASEAQRIVNEVQIKELSVIIDMLAELLGDRQKRYFIIIDRLDEDWVEDELRYKLIRALIETVKDFTKVRNAKIVIALRIDLLERVYNTTRDAGFQEEKYEELYLHVKWTKELLEKLLEKRINHLLKSRYGNGHVSLKDVLTQRVGHVDAIDYILDRTLLRPRDLIHFFNICILHACDRPEITAQVIREAEGEYSRDRLRSIADEWYGDYPNLIEFAQILSNRDPEFLLSTIDDNECANFCLHFLTKVEGGNFSRDDLYTAAKSLYDGSISTEEFRRTVFYVLHRVGIVALRTEKKEPPNWATTRRRSIGANSIENRTGVVVHKMLWRVFHIADSR